MLLKYTVLFVVLVAGLHSATLQGRNIPVEIRYERYDHDITSNLAEKVQLSPVQLKENQLRIQKHKAADHHSNSIKNLEQKVQLSPEELRQATKHAPHNKLGELPESSLSSSSSSTKLIQQAQDVVERGLENLRKNFVPKENEVAPPKELWEKLEADVKQYFTEQKNRFGSRQDPGATQQNIFQSIVHGFQQMSNNFVQQLQNRPNSTSSDEGTAPGPIQGFVGYFTGGVQNIVSNIQNLGQTGQQLAGNSTVLGDTPGGQQQPPNIIGSFVNGVQQFFQGPQQGINQILSPNNTQGDTGSSNPAIGQQGFFAGAINQFNNVVGNIIPTSQKPPSAQGDEGSGTTATNQPSSGNPIQQVFQTFGNLGTAFNQFIQGGQQQQQNKPQGSEDESSSQPPNQNFIQNIGQNIGNAFQNLQNQFRPTPKPGEGGASSSSNPIVDQVSNIGTQIQQVAGQAVSSSPFQNIIPGSSSSESSVKNPATSQSDTTSEKVQPEENKTEESEKKEVMTATE